MKFSVSLHITVFFHFYSGISNTKAMMGYINTNFALPDLSPWTLSDTVSVTLSECFMLCQTSTPCQGIMYQRSIEGCMLLSYDYTEADTMTAASIGSSATVPDQTTWVFYHVIRDCQQAGCPIGYTFVSEVCFCMKYHRNPKPYDAAVQQCQIEGGELIKIDKTLVQVYVEQFLERRDVTVSDRVYIQGKKFGTQWLFDDGTELPYYKWAPHQPNNNVGEDILFLSTPDHWQWQDGGHGSYSFLCKINL